MQNAESHTHILFFVQLKAHSLYQLVPKPRMCPPHPQLDRGAKSLAEGNPTSVNFCFQLVVQPRFLISRDAASHRAFNCGQAKTGQSITSTRGATPKRESPSPQLKGPHQSVGVHGEDEQKKCVKGWKWVKVGENPKMPYPPCGRSIKPMLGATMMPLVSQSMGIQYG